MLTTVSHAYQNKTTSTIKYIRPQHVLFQQFFWERTVGAVKMRSAALLIYSELKRP